MSANLNQTTDRGTARPCLDRLAVRRCWEALRWPARGGCFWRTFATRTSWLFGTVAVKTKSSASKSTPLPVVPFI